VDQTPQQLRQQAEHCRHLAESQFDEWVRLILRNMADEFEQQATNSEYSAERTT